MKVTLLVVLVALVACVAAEVMSETSKLQGFDKASTSSEHRLSIVKESTKTFVEMSPGTWRFCIPLGYGLMQNEHSIVTMYVRNKEGFSIIFDTHPDQTHHVAHSMGYGPEHKIKIISLVKSGLKELAKDGTVSGIIIAKNAPKWVGLKLETTHLLRLTDAPATCKAVLGRPSESAHLGNDCDDASSGDYAHNMQVRRVLGILITGSGFVVILAGLLVVALIIRARCKRNQQIADAEMTAMDVAASEEERQLAEAIEASLAEQEKQKVVPVPQAAAPQFVFVPPQFMPPMHHDGNGTPYVPMFAPQFMNYSFDTEKH